ncbi:MAG: Crp/Fnr family transcriptional regulator [Leptospiraceae bacterium]|nr:Crp/Fnr family transcriptional regulator [Leptospiraceae bacterium]
MKANTDLLRHLEFFHEFHIKEVESLSKISTIREVKEGEILFNEDDDLDELSIVIDGKIMIGMTVANKRKIGLETVISGQPLGWSALIPPYTATSFAQVQQSGKLVVFRATELEALFQEERDGNLGYNFLLNLSKHISIRLRTSRYQLIKNLS